MKRKIDPEKIYVREREYGFGIVKGSRITPTMKIVSKGFMTENGAIIEKIGLEAKDRAKRLLKD